MLSNSLDIARASRTVQTYTSNAAEALSSKGIDAYKHLLLQFSQQ
jgi:hypothetical protein